MSIKLKKHFQSLDSRKVFGGTDKERAHRYSETYELIFNSQYAKKGGPLSVLEIGVWKGGSLMAYLKQGEQYINRIVGVDIQNRLRKCYRGHINDSPFCHVMFEDAYTDDFINKVESKHGKFDIIIDDGPHTCETQEFFLTKYNKLLRDGGVLMCEDVPYDFLSEREDQPEPCLEDLKKLRDKYNLYIIDLRHNQDRDKRADSIIILRYA